MSKLHWKPLPEEGSLRANLMRARIPQGWLVAGDHGALTFVPDAGGQWDLEALSEAKVQQSVEAIEQRLGDLEPPPAEELGAT